MVEVVSCARIRTRNWYEGSDGAGFESIEVHKFKVTLANLEMLASDFKLGRGGPGRAANSTQVIVTLNYRDGIQVRAAEVGEPLTLLLSLTPTCDYGV